MVFPLSPLGNPGLEKFDVPGHLRDRPSDLGGIRSVSSSTGDPVDEFALLEAAPGTIACPSDFSLAKAGFFLRV